MTTPHEAAAVPRASLDVDNRDLGPPPISRAAVVSLVLTLSPVLILGVTIAGDFAEGAERAAGMFGFVSQAASWLLLFVFALGPIGGLVTAVRTFRRLGLQSADERPRGRAICVVAMVLGGLWLAFLALAFVGGMLVALLTGAPGS